MPLDESAVSNSGPLSTEQGPHDRQRTSADGRVGKRMTASDGTRPKSDLTIVEGVSVTPHRANRSVARACVPRSRPRRDDDVSASDGRTGSAPRQDRLDPRPRLVACGIKTNLALWSPASVVFGKQKQRYGLCCSPAESSPGLMTKTFMRPRMRSGAHCTSVTRGGRCQHAPSLEA